MKSVCAKHERAYETECPYCEPAAVATKLPARPVVISLLNQLPSHLNGWFKDMHNQHYGQGQLNAQQIQQAMNEAWVKLQPTNATAGNLPIWSSGQCFSVIMTGFSCKHRFGSSARCTDCGITAENALAAGWLPGP